MSKIAVNNEIVLMRQAVRKARLKVVWKLNKEVKLLKSRSHGDEKVIEKCKRKADKLTGELAVLKKTKDDEISKFAITNDKNLDEVLADTSAELKVRVLTRMAFNEILKKRVEEFKKKFTDYEKYLGPGRKALAKMKVKERKKARKLEEKAKNEAEARQAGGDYDGVEEESRTEEENECVDGDNQPEDEEHESEDEKEEDENESEDDKEEEEGEEDNKTEDEQEEENESEVEEDEPEEYNEQKQQETLDKPVKENSKIPALENKKEKTEQIKQKEPSTSSNKKLENNIINKKNPVKGPSQEKKQNISKVPAAKINSPLKQNKRKNIKVVSNLATVKRLKLDNNNDEIEEISENVDNNDNDKDNIKATEEEIHLEKEEDSFFITGNGQSAYQSIAVPKLTQPQNNEHDDDDNNKYLRNNYNRNSFNNVERKNDRRNNFSNDKRNNNFTNDRRNNNQANNKRDSHFSKRDNTKFEPRNNRKNNNFDKIPKKNDNKSNETDLHPSWQAKKKQQDILKQGFQGKKIKFDD